MKRYQIIVHNEHGASEVYQASTRAGIARWLERTWSDVHRLTARVVASESGKEVGSKGFGRRRIQWERQEGRMMRPYIVYRHGSNAANQSMTPLMPVGIWEADSREEAIRRAAMEVVIYANQHLTARAYSRVSHAGQQAASEADHAREIAAQELAEWKQANEPRR
jgi:hypothetical protein